MITTGLMKSEEIAAERSKEYSARANDAVTRLDPTFPYATLPFPEGFGAMDNNEKEL